MKKQVLIIVFLLTVIMNTAKSQNTNFVSAYNTIEWPIELGVKGGITGDDYYYKRLTFYHGNSIAFETGTNSPDYHYNRLFIDAEGRIGINTSTPNYPLSFGVNNGTTIALFENGGNGLSGIRYNASHIGLELITNGIVGLSVNGKYIGIGTTTPAHELDVNGTIRAKEVKVTLDGWSDYVFHPTYHLKPLSEVKQYIKTHGHLENIPTAEEVEQNGVSVGEMQARLLEKIEQLMLYSIELKEENIEQEKQNAILQQQLAGQQARYEQLLTEVQELKSLVKK